MSSPKSQRSSLAAIFSSALVCASILPCGKWLIKRCFDFQSLSFSPALLQAILTSRLQDFTLVGLAPWINAECTQEYMAAAHLDPCRALIFYLPNNDTTQPPPANSDVWSLNDGDAWQSTFQYPVCAIPGAVGYGLMHELSLYSGNMTNVPFGHEISELPNTDPRDYVRLYTHLVTSNSSTLPSFWVFLVVVLVIAVLTVGTISASMHLMQRARRKSMQRRVASGEVNLEALGIKRLTVPQEFIDRLPLFIYASEEQSPPASPQQKKPAASVVERPIFQEGTSSSTPPAHHRSGGSHVSIDNTQPQLIMVDDSTSNSDSVLVHKFLPYSQPTCAICLDNFEPGITEIRELPCGHIFHTECIDIFLGNNSSLCPLCKKSALPIGYCPVKITNAMVRAERNLRKIRSTVMISEEEHNAITGHARSRMQNWRSIVKRNMFSPTPPAAAASYTVPLQPQPVFMTNAIPPHSHAEDDRTADDVEAARLELVEQRIRELARVPIQDPDIIHERERPQCKLPSRS
jgi:Ring finger domain